MYTKKFNIFIRILFKFVLFGIVNSSRIPYQYDPRIHTLGNIGYKGSIHAAMSPLCTWMIDTIAYDGVDIRKLIKDEYCKNSKTLDLCCGTGYSSTPGGIGIDTSPEMLRVANMVNPDTRYIIGNAEYYQYPHEIVTCMFALHEIPRRNRIKLIKNAVKNAKKRVILVDIHERYTPSYAMLAGEPYLFDYLSFAKIDVINACTMFGKKCIYEEIIPYHVQMWIIE